MAGQAETDPRATATAERREVPIARLEIDPDPRKLRKSIALLDDALGELEEEPARRVRLLVCELIARSAEARPRPRGSVRLELSMSRSCVRVEISGAALLTPSEDDERDRKPEALFPYWSLDGLADRWALDRRAPGRAMWFEVRRA